MKTNTIDFYGHIPVAKRDEKYGWLLSEKRTYLLEDVLGARGAFSVPYKGYPIEPNSPNKLRHPDCHKDQNFVIKIALPTAGSSQAAIRKRLEYQQHKFLEEFSLIRRQLLNSKYVNPLIDIYFQLNASTLTLTPMSVQPFLDKHWALDRWLNEKGLRGELAERDEHGRLKSNRWRGVASRSEYLQVAINIAIALVDVHANRVVHGDAHPGNIFLPIDNRGNVKLIDFGEAFLWESIENSRSRRRREYLAPERIGLESMRGHRARRFPLNERVDVYAFGTLLLYLAIGQEISFDAEQLEFRHRHILNWIRDRNGPLIDGEPRIVDVIVQCLDKDPADRPSMREVLHLLRDIHGHTPTPKSTLFASGGATQLLVRSTQSNWSREHPQILSLIADKCRVVGDQFVGIGSNMLELEGTRTSLIRHLCIFFEQLKSGDSWTSVTHIPVWQRQGLGLLGPYLSANIRAILRGVSIRRSLVVSVEELGHDFLKMLEQELVGTSGSDNPLIAAASAEIKEALDKFSSLSNVDRSIAEETARAYHYWHARAFRDYLECFSTAIAEWDLTQFIEDNTTFQQIDFESTPNGKSMFGLKMVDTIEKLIEEREKNPASLVHLPSVGDPRHKWLLVETQIRDRFNFDDPKFGFSPPSLLGIRIFKSRQILSKDKIVKNGSLRTVDRMLVGKPEGRLVNAKTHFAESANIGPIMGELARKCSVVLAKLGVGGTIP